MVENLLARTDTDLALAVKGFAGRAGTEDEPGLVYLTCAGRGATRLKCIEAAAALLEDTFPPS